MQRFFLGFLAATLVWAASFAVLHARGFVTVSALEEPAIEALEGADEVEADPAADRRRGKRARRARAERTRAERSHGGGSAQPSSAQAKELPGGEATTGDDLGWSEQQRVAMDGAEGQLSGKQIEAGFDGALAKIRRCLVLVPAEGEVTGKLVFGMKVGSDGVPKAVNLSGPAVVTTGESGSCLRSAAQAIRFGSYAGPDTLFKYPINLQ